MNDTANPINQKYNRLFGLKYAIEVDIHNFPLVSSVDIHNDFPDEPSHGSYTVVSPPDMGTY